MRSADGGQSVLLLLLLLLLLLVSAVYFCAVHAAVIVRSLQIQKINNLQVTRTSCYMTLNLYQ
jgi:hypothetical protein